MIILYMNTLDRDLVVYRRDKSLWLYSIWIPWIEIWLFTGGTNHCATMSTKFCWVLELKFVCWNGTLCIFFLPLLSLSLFFSPFKKKRHRIKRERTVIATIKCTELRLIIFHVYSRVIAFYLNDKKATRFYYT